MASPVLAGLIGLPATGVSLVPIGAIEPWVAGLTALGGAALAWSITRAFYRRRVRTQAAESRLRVGELTERVQELATELERARTERADLELVEEAFTRVGRYAAHILSLVQNLLNGEAILEDFAKRQPSEGICDLTHEHIAHATGQEVCVSIWAESPPWGLGRLASQQASKAVSARVASLSTFEVLAASPRRQPEVDAFAEVSVGASWLKHRRADEERTREPNVYPVNDFATTDANGPDIDAFKAHGYRSVRAVSLRRRNRVAYLIVLGREPDLFSTVEDVYVLWLRHVLELDALIRGGARAG